MGSSRERELLDQQARRGEMIVVRIVAMDVDLVIRALRYFAKNHPRQRPEVERQIDRLLHEQTQQGSPKAQE